MRTNPHLSVSQATVLNKTLNKLTLQLLLVLVFCFPSTQMSALAVGVRFLNVLLLVSLVECVLP